MAHPRTERKSVARLEEQRLQYKAFRLTMWVPVVQNLIRWSGVVGAVFFGYRAVEALAGEATDASFAVHLLASEYAGHVLVALFGGGGIAYGWRQRKLRRDVVERLSTRIEAYETRLDGERGSSGLTRRGETHPGDEA